MYGYNIKCKESHILACSVRNLPDKSETVKCPVCEQCFSL